MALVPRLSLEIDECMKEPELPPSPLINELSFQSIMGVLEKYVNIGHGWRKRLCVLKGGVLRYYKVDDASSAAIQVLLDHARENGDITSSLQSQTMTVRDGSRQSKKDLASSSSKSVAKTIPETLAILGEVHLQIASVLNSQSGDSKRFTIHSGTKKLRFRAESELDKKAWMDALQLTKKHSVYWSNVSATGVIPTTLSAPEEVEETIVAAAHGHSDSLFDALTIPDIRQKLLGAGATETQVKICEDFMMDQHRFYINYMQKEAEKRTLLIKHIRTLEVSTIDCHSQRVGASGQEDKRLLEQQIVVDEQVDDAPTDGLSYPEYTQQTTVENDDAANDAGSQDGSEGGYESEEDVFYDCFGSSDAPETPKISEATASSSNQVEVTPSSSGFQQGQPSTDTMYKVNGPVAMSSQQLQQWLKENGAPLSRRDRLPKPLQKEKKVGLWGIIKECIGKDLTKICLPVYFNEPLSALQKVSEELEYAHLLDEAIQHPPGSVERMLYISAWAVSGYGGTVGRTTKPFNPLLGETFEFVNPEKGYRFLGEKVVHHPTVFSLYCQGTGWEVAADTDLKSKFWGSSIELRPVGVILLKTEDGETYKLNKVTTSINNLIIGRLEIDHYGLMKVQNLTAKMTGKIKFMEKRMFSRTPHQVDGHFEGPEGHLTDVSLRGVWSEYLMADAGKGAGPFEIWRKNPPAVEPTRYNLSTFAIQLNELTADIDGKIAPTDSRMRPDQQFLENGMYNEANYEKQRLEHQQRAARKAAEKGDPIQPRWFKHVPDAKPGEQLTFVYKGGYWDSRDHGVFEGCRDIFGNHIDLEPAKSGLLSSFHLQ